jgi:ribA/ribD-fused uncharacterized protein
MTSELRTYDPGDCAVFWKTREPLGELSNMASGFPVAVGRTLWPTTEALYQACRFPHLPEIQQMLMSEPSAMAAKMRSKPYRPQTRPDWHSVRIPVMRWCIRLKFQQHRNTFGASLLATAPRTVVERSTRDRYWGAVLDNDGLLRGENVLGRLLQEVREHALDEAPEVWAIPPDVSGFALPHGPPTAGAEQLGLFDLPR